MESLDVQSIFELSLYTEQAYRARFLLLKQRESPRPVYKPWNVYKLVVRMIQFCVQPWYHVHT